MGKKAKIRRGLKNALKVHGPRYGIPIPARRVVYEQNLEPHRLYAGHRVVNQEPEVEVEVEAVQD